MVTMPSPLLANMICSICDAAVKYPNGLKTSDF